MDLGISPQTLHLVVDSDPTLDNLADCLRQSGLTVSTLPTASGLAGMEAAFERDVAGQTFRSISLYSHASQGALSLGHNVVRKSNLNKYRSFFEAVGRHLAPGGDLLIYGCNLAAGAKGHDFLQSLSGLVGADVAGSTNITGRDGDWRLEVTTGAIEEPQQDLLTGLSWDHNLTSITEPIRVPLHWQHVNGSADKPRKLGLYVSLGEGRTPQLMEFDTGGPGLFATYAPGDVSPWWGTQWSDTGDPFEMSYDSGLNYTGDVVRTQVAIFADQSAKEPLLQCDDVTVGQAQMVTKTDGANVTNLWPLPTADSLPPTDGAFWGDFGMALQPGQSGVDSLPMQLSYGKGVRAGFRVHASSKNPWVQFGLTSEDLRDDQGATLALNPHKGRSRTGVPFYKFKVAKGSLSVDVPRTKSSRHETYSRPLGILFDTGAYTTIHSSPTEAFPLRLSQDRAGAQLSKGAKVVLMGDQPLYRQRHDQVAVLKLKAGNQIDDNLVTLQTTNRFYINTGILPFLSQDLIYDLQGGRLKLIKRKQP